MGKNELKLPLWKILYDNILIILLCTVVCLGGAIAFAYTMIRPSYLAESNVLLVVSMPYSEGSVSGTSNEITISKIYLPTIAKSITTTKIANLANDDKYYDGEYGIIIKNNVTAVIGEEVKSLIFTVSYADSTKEGAETKLSAVIKAFKDDLNEHPEDYIPVDTIDLVPTQKNPTVKKIDGKGKVVGTGAVVGLVIGLLVAFIKAISDNKVKSTTELEEITGVPVLAFIVKQ